MKERRPVPDQSKLKMLLHYNPDTGEFTRIADRGKWKSGQLMGTVSGDGYLNLSIDYVIYRAHRVAWTYMTGAQPPDYLDHENGDTLDNRWKNIREASQSENLQNKTVQKSNRLGVKGVSMIKGRYRARVTAKGKTLFEENYQTLEEAKAARDAAAKVFHQGFFRS